MTVLDILQTNLLSPMVLAFALGLVATLVKSDLKFPNEIYTALSIYLLFAIGLKGGAELAQTSLQQFWMPALAALMLGLGIPLWSYALLRLAGRFAVADAAAIAAHYGSVSVVTFSAAQTYLQNLGLTAEGFMPTLLALLEVPGIVVALLIARSRMQGAGSWGAVLHELLTGRSVVLLLGGLIVGALAGPGGLEQVAPFFVDPFRGVLTFFLLEMGMLTAQRFGDFRKVGAFLIGFGLVMPVLHGLLGAWIGSLAGLSLGGTFLLATLAGSASYIAAPAAVRIALPEANPSFYLTAALAITFPFNLALGLPLYFEIARLLHG